MKNDQQNQFLTRPIISVALAIAMGAATVGCETTGGVNPMGDAFQTYVVPMAGGVLGGILASKAGASKPLAVAIGIGVGALTAHFIAKAKATQQQKEEVNRRAAEASKTLPVASAGQTNSTPKIYAVEVTPTGPSTAGSSTTPPPANQAPTTEAPKEEKVQLVFYDSEKKQIVGDQVWESAVRPKNGEEIVIEGQRAVFVAGTPTP